MTQPNGERYRAVIDNQEQLEAGFDFIQRTGFLGTQTQQRYWAIRNNIYIRQDAVLHPEIVLDKYYKGEMFLEIPKFRSNVFWEIIWFPGAEYMCLQLGFNSDPISVLLRAGFNVLECYKVIVQTFLDWSQWSPEFFASGRIFDMCQSSITSNAQIYRLNIYSKLSSVD